MRVTKLLHNIFDNTSSRLDKRLFKSVFACVDSVLNGDCLYIASLGRHMRGSAKIKHKIKRVNRLFSNENLHKNVDVFYKKISAYVINQNVRPIIIVDGSRFSDCGKYQFLSASVPFKRRAIPIYEEAFRENKILKRSTLAY